jgi:hypothetical protein
LGSSENVRDKFSDFLCKNPIDKDPYSRQKIIPSLEIEVWNLSGIWSLGFGI